VMRVDVSLPGLVCVTLIIQTVLLIGVTSEDSRSKNIGTGYESHPSDAYQFYSEPVPAENSLHTIYAFHVCPRPGSMLHRSEPVPTTVKFDLTVQATVAEQSQEYYRSIQVTLVNYDDLWKVVNQQKFCCDLRDKRLGKCTYPNQLLLHWEKCTLPFKCALLEETIGFKLATTASGTVEVTKHLQSPGTYVLVVSNCGGFDNATISGSVSIWNPIKFSRFLGCSKYADMPGNVLENLTSTFAEAALSALSDQVSKAKNLQYAHKVVSPGMSQAAALKAAKPQGSRSERFKEKRQLVTPLAPWLITGVAVTCALCCGSIAFGIFCHACLLRKRDGGLRPPLIETEAMDYNELEEYIEHEYHIGAAS